MLSIRSIVCAMTMGSLISFFSGPAAQAEPPADSEVATAVSLIRNMTALFRSSDRYVPALTLYQVAGPRIPADLNVGLSNMSVGAFRDALLQLQQELFIDRGTAENLIKYHAIQRMLCRGICFLPSEAQQLSMGQTQDSVLGLTQDQLDSMVAAFPEAIVDKPPFEQEFDYRRFDILQRVIRPMALNNDHYNPRMAAAFLNYEWHLQEKTTYRLYARGVQDRAYMIVAGTDFVLELLRNLKFEEREIQFLKQHPDFKNVSPAFFEKLRTWRFTGSIRMFPPGSIAFNEEPIMEFTGNKFDAQLVETIIVPIVAGLTYMATTTRRAVSVANGIPIVDGGTRRSLNGIWGAIAAVIGGAAGTSNDEVARLFDVAAFGSMAHAYDSQNESTLRAYAEYLNLFPTSGVPLDKTADMLGAYYDLVRAGSMLPQLRYRVDSLMKGKSRSETLRTVQNAAAEIGFADSSATLSDGLDEASIQVLTEEGASVSSYLVGTALHAIPGAGFHFVYKPVERVTVAGDVVPMAKTTVGKEGIAGQTQVWRKIMVDDADPTRRTFLGDTIADVNEVISPSSEDPQLLPGTHLEIRPQLVDGMIDGKRVLKWESLPQIARRAAREWSALSPDVRDISAKRGVYPVSVTERVNDKLIEVIRREKPPEGKKVILYFGSFDPIHSGHLEMAYRAYKVYRADEFIFVPTGDSPVHKERHTLSAKQRADSIDTEIQRYIADGLNMRVSRLETTGQTRFTADTVKALKGTLPSNADIYLLVGEDTFSTLPTWKEALPDLLQNNWIVAARGGAGKLPEYESQLDGGADYERVTPWLLINRELKTTIEMVNFRTGTYSSTQVRERMRGIQAIFHGVDIQDTFFRFSKNDPLHRDDGVLGVLESDLIIGNIVQLQQLAHSHGRIKNILTKDFHLDVELTDPKFNGEFHPNPDLIIEGKPFEGFPAHGMALRSGPTGHQLLAEIRDIFPNERQLIVPHHRQVYAADPEDDSMELTPFDPEAHMHEILDPLNQIIIQKNGPHSYNFAMNPRSKVIVDAIGKKPVFVYGVATDFCVLAAVQEYLKWGHEVYLVEDAIRGVYPGKSSQDIEWMRANGVKFVTTQQVLAQFAAKDACVDALH